MNYYMRAAESDALSPYSTESLLKAFASQAEAFSRAHQSADNADLMVLPFSCRGRTKSADYDGKVILIAAPRKKTWAKSFKRGMDIGVVMRPITRSTIVTMRGQSGLYHTKVDVARSLLEDVLSPERIISPARPLFEDTAIVTDFETPAALRPLQFYSVSGDRSQLAAQMGKLSWQ